MDSERAEKLLAMILLHDMQDAPQAERAVALSRAGFGNPEIAELLGTTAAVVAQQLYSRRSRRSGTAGKKPARRKRGGR
jgi:hypothetical protein